jgi:hypothetical protein
MDAAVLAAQPGGSWPLGSEPRASGRSGSAFGSAATCSSGSEDGGGDAQASGGGGEAGLVLAGGDLAGDRAELVAIVDSLARRVSRANSILDSSTGVSATFT